MNFLFSPSFFLAACAVAAYASRAFLPVGSDIVNLFGSFLPDLNGAFLPVTFLLVVFLPVTFLPLPVVVVLIFPRFAALNLLAPFLPFLEPSLKILPLLNLVEDRSVFDDATNFLAVADNLFALALASLICSSVNPAPVLTLLFLFAAGIPILAPLPLYVFRTYWHI